MGEQRKRKIINAPFQVRAALTLVLSLIIAINLIIVVGSLSPGILGIQVVISGAGYIVIGAMEVAVIVLAWTLSIRQTHRVSGPVYAIAREAKKLSRGDLTASVQVRKHDEFAETASTVNAGIAHVRDEVARIKELAAELETRVDTEEGRETLARLRQRLDQLQTEANPEAERSTPGRKGGHKEVGFTLLELLFVIAIVSILTVISLPFYFDYATRTRVSEGVNTMGALKTRVAEAYYNNGTFPSTNGEAGMGDPGDYSTDHISQIQVSGSGVVTVTFAIASLGGNNRLSFIPTDAGDGSIEWECTSPPGNGVETAYLPPECR